MSNLDKSLYEDIKFGTNIITGDEYLESITAIADVASDMVVKTLGPYGKTTIIDDGVVTYPTKDGWNVLKRLRFNDPIYNTLYGVLKQISFELVSRVGDGTTSSFIGATIFLHKIIHYMNGNEFRQVDFLEDLNNLTEKIVENLENSKYVRKINLDGDYSDIYKIAYVASNGNEKLASMIQDIYQQTNNPNIYISYDASTSLTHTIQRGYKFDCNPVNQKAYRNMEDGTFSLAEQNIMFAIFDHNVNYTEHEKLITGLSRYATAHNATIFILAPHFDDVLLNIIGTSINGLFQQGQVPNIMLVQVPMSSTISKEYLSDMILLTNAQVFDYGKVKAFNVLVHNQAVTDEKDRIEDTLLDSDQYNFTEPSEIIKLCVGKAVNVTVDKDFLILRDYESVVNKNLYNNKIAEVKETFKELKDKADKSTTTLQKDYMNAYQHYTKLFGNMGIIKVGGTSDLEKHCLKDVIDDAVLACRSAFDCGYIRGLNLTTLNVIDSMLKEDCYRQSEKEILTLLKETFFEMSKKVILNKHSDGMIHNIISEGEDIGTYSIDTMLETAISEELGFDLVHDTLMTDSECTVVNSVKTDIEILKGMVSILSTMLTSNQFLSINRNYDRAQGKKQKLEELQDVQIAKTIATISAITEAIKENPTLKDIVTNILLK